MLPILRILPVGGVILAIVILVLALSPPDGSRSSLTATIAPARGALVDRNRHPEVRQFLILAALKRASELSRLRDLQDSPVRSDEPPKQPKLQVCPANEPTPSRKKSDRRTRRPASPFQSKSANRRQPSCPPPRKRKLRRRQENRSRRKHRAKSDAARLIGRAIRWR